MTTRSPLTHRQPASIRAGDDGQPLARDHAIHDEKTRDGAEPDADRAPRAARNETTLREVFDQHARFVWRTLRHLGIREDDLADLCQEVFVVVHRKLSDFEGRSSISTWLYGICLRVARDHRRRAHVRREVAVAELPVEHTSTSQDAALKRNESRALLARLLSSLDDTKREVFVLYEIEGLGMKEVADAVGCPLQTAYSRLHAARALLSEKARALESGAIEPAVGDE